MVKSIKKTKTSNEQTEIPFRDFTFEKFYKCFKATKNSDTKKEYILNLNHIYSFLRENLDNYKYYPQPYNCFLVSEPKPREIFAPAFIDRIMQHYLVSKIRKIEEFFIEDNYANRKEKGTHKAIQKVQYYMRQIPQKTAYYMQCDIKSFFLSIDKNILWKILEKHIKSLKYPLLEEKEILYLANKILYQDEIHNLNLTGSKHLLNTIPKHKSMFHKKKSKGLPIGSLTSQLFSSIYLNELDQFITKQLGIKRYVRYVDDFVIIEDDKEKFNSYQKQIRLFLKTKLDLELHPNKTKIQHTTKGLDFLGYIIRLHYLLVRKRTINMLKTKLRFFNYILNPENYNSKEVRKYFETMKLAKYINKNYIQIPIKNPSLLVIKSMQDTINSYYGIISFASSYKLRVKIYHNHFKALKEYLYPKNSFKAFGIIPARVLKWEF